MTAIKLEIDEQLERAQREIDKTVVSRAGLGDIDKVTRISFYLAEDGKTLFIAPNSMDAESRTAAILKAIVLDLNNSNDGETAGQKLSKFAVCLLRAAVNKDASFMLVIETGGNLAEIQGTMPVDVAPGILRDAAKYVAETPCNTEVTAPTVLN
jgi:hypothetical protein